MLRAAHQDISRQLVSAQVERMDLRHVYLNYRPCLLFCCWNYMRGPEEWVTRMKESVRDPDFMIDVPERGGRAAGGDAAEADRGDAAAATWRFR